MCVNGHEGLKTEKVCSFIHLFIYRISVSHSQTGFKMCIKYPIKFFISKFHYIVGQHQNDQRLALLIIIFYHRVWRIHFPLRERGRKETLFTILLLAENMWTRTLKVWSCWKTFLFLPPTPFFWIRVRGGNWMGLEIAFYRARLLFSYFRLKRNSVPLTKCFGLWFRFIVSSKAICVIVSLLTKLMSVVSRLLKYYTRTILPPQL